MMASSSDAERLKFLMQEGPDGFVNVLKDRHQYAMEVAEEKGREIPNEQDEIEGFRRMIDCAMEGGDVKWSKAPANLGTKFRSGAK